MSQINEAASLLSAVASPRRLMLLAVASDRARNGEDTSVQAVATSLSVDLKDLMKDVARLQDCGLVRMDGHRMSVSLETLGDTAQALVAELPITRLLADQPDVARFFKHGRLTSVPANFQTLKALAGLLVQLLPTDETLTEAEVNAALAQVYDDYATLRRLLVDFMLVTRDGSLNYRRSTPSAVTNL